MTLFRAALLSCCVAATLVLHAAGGFTATLSQDRFAACGLAVLADAERAALDQLIANEVALRREEDPAVPTAGFSTRCSAEQHQAAGLHRLSPVELAQLDQSIAAVVTRPAPKTRPRLKESEVIYGRPRQPEIHGSISLTYGWGAGGRDFRASSLWVTIEDPDRRFGLGIGVSTSKGDLFPGYYYPDHGYWDYGPRWHPMWESWTDPVETWPRRGVFYPDNISRRYERFLHTGPGW